MKRLADRVRSLMNTGGNPEGWDLERAAAELGVRTEALREVADRLTRVPPLDVLEKVIRRYAVDPNWLLTGRYDPRTHEIAGEVSHDPGRLRALLADLIGDRRSSGITSRAVINRLHYGR